MSEYRGKHRRVIINEPTTPKRDHRPAEMLTTSEALTALEWLLVSCDPDVESLSVDYGGRAYNVVPRAYVRIEH